MLENISLIEEANFFVSKTQAEQNAYQYLKELNLGHIENLRTFQCLPREIFYTQLIRALLTKKNHIMIALAFQMINEQKHLENLFRNLIHLGNYHCQKADSSLLITLIDTKMNEHLYQNCPCHTIK